MINPGRDQQTGAVEAWRWRHGGRTLPSMPRYEFRCRECARLGGHATFEVDRPMAAASDPASCPQGHGDTQKLLSTVALGGRAPAMAAPSGGGGCCGGGCCG
jgi:putative FmdB family regulatory protein